MIPRAIHIAIPVWGKEYVTFFLRNSLESQLTELNLPYFSKRFNVVYKIYTDRGSMELIHESSSIKRLKKLVQVECTDLDTLRVYDEPGNNFINRIYQYAFEEAFSQNAALMPLCPDFIYCNDFYKDISPYILEGKRIIFKLSMRGIKENFFKEYERRVKNFEALDKSSFVDLFFKSVPSTDQKCISENLVYDWPSILFWKIDANNFYSQCCHLHPAYVWPEVNQLSLLSNGTIDNSSFLDACCPNYKTHSFLKGEEALMMEMSSEKHFIGAVGNIRKKSSLYQDNFFEITTAPSQIKRQFLFRKFLFSCAPPNSFSKLSAQCKIFLFSFKIWLLMKLPFKLKRLIFFYRKA